MSIFRKFERQSLRNKVKSTKQTLSKKGKRLVQFKDKDGKIKVTTIDVQKPYRKSLEEKA